MFSFFGGSASTPEPTPAPTPTEQPEAARPATRNQTSTSEDPQFLVLPDNYRRDIARNRIRRRSPTPSPQPLNADAPAFVFPTPSLEMDEATIQRLMEAAITATQRSSTQHVQTLRKPDLPVFDKRNVEIWIRRVEAAYTRINCTNPALKFAYLDSKFEVNADPIIDGFLFGDATEENWDAFLDYLRTRHGPTKKEQALSVINGIPREGRTPSQLAAVMKDKAGKVSLDDIMKEQLLKQLPHDILKHLVDRVDKLTFEETAKLADAWFDKDGKPLIAASTSTVNNVVRAPPTPSSTAPASASAPEPPFTPVFSQNGDDETDVNAIRFRQGQRQRFDVNNRGGSRGRGRGGGNSSGNGGRNDNGGRNQSNNNNTNSYGNSSSYSAQGKPRKKQVCDFHVKFGEEARRCEEWCILWPKHSSAKGKPAI